MQRFGKITKLFIEGKQKHFNEEIPFLNLVKRNLKIDDVVDIEYGSIEEEDTEDIETFTTELINEYQLAAIETKDNDDHIYKLHFASLLVEGLVRFESSSQGIYEKSLKEIIKSKSTSSYKENVTLNLYRISYAFLKLIDEHDIENEFSRNINEISSVIGLNLEEEYIKFSEILTDKNLFINAAIIEIIKFILIEDAAEDAKKNSKKDKLSQKRQVTVDFVRNLVSKYRDCFVPQTWKWLGKTQWEFQYENIELLPVLHMGNSNELVKFTLSSSNSNANFATILNYFSDELLDDHIHELKEYVSSISFFINFVNDYKADKLIFMIMNINRYAVLKVFWQWFLNAKTNHQIYSNETGKILLMPSVFLLEMLVEEVKKSLCHVTSTCLFKIFISVYQEKADGSIDTTLKKVLTGKPAVKRQKTAEHGHKEQSISAIKSTAEHSGNPRTQKAHYLEFIASFISSHPSMLFHTFLGKVSDSSLKKCLSMLGENIRSDVVKQLFLASQYETRLVPIAYAYWQDIKCALDFPLDCETIVKHINYEQTTWKTSFFFSFYWKCVFLFSKKSLYSLILFFDFTVEVYSSMLEFMNRELLIELLSILPKECQVPSLKSFVNMKTNANAFLKYVAIPFLVLKEEMTLLPLLIPILTVELFNHTIELTSNMNIINELFLKSSFKVVSNFIFHFQSEKCHRHVAEMIEQNAQNHNFLFSIIKNSNNISALDFEFPKELYTLISAHIEYLCLGNEDPHNKFILNIIAIIRRKSELSHCILQNVNFWLLLAQNGIALADDDFCYFLTSGIHLFNEFYAYLHKISQINQQIQRWNIYFNKGKA